MEINLNLRLVNDETLKHLVRAFLAECTSNLKVHGHIAEQRESMFKAAINECTKRNIDTTDARTAFDKVKKR